VLSLGGRAQPDSCQVMTGCRLARSRSTTATAQGIHLKERPASHQEMPGYSV